MLIRVKLLFDSMAIYLIKVIANILNKTRNNILNKRTTSLRAKRRELPSNSTEMRQKKYSVKVVTAISLDDPKRKMKHFNFIN